MKATVIILAVIILLFLYGMVNAQNVEQVSAPLFTDSFRSFKVVDDLAYVVGSNALQIFSVTDPSNQFSVGGYALDYASWVNDVFVSGNYVYLTYGDVISNSWGVLILDMADPFNVTLTGSYNTPMDPPNIIVDGDYAYTAVFDYGLYIHDISDPANPEYVGNCSTTVYQIFLSGGYVYASGDQHDLKIIDVSNPTNPALVGSYEFPGYIYSIFVSGDYGYVCWSEYQSGHGTEIINVSDPANPEIIASLPNIVGDINVVGDYAYVASGGLQIIDVSDPADPEIIGNYDSEELAYDISISGDYAYIMWQPWGDWLERYDPGGFEIINIVHPEEPALAGVCRSHSFVSGVFVDSIYSYVADGGGLQIIDVSEPSVPSYMASCDTPDDATDIFLSGDYAYVAWGYCEGWYDIEICVGGLQIINITDPANPIFVGGCEFNGRPSDVSISGNFAYILQETVFEAPDFVVFDISDPSNPVEVGSYEGRTKDVFVNNNLAYLARGSQGLLILDVFDPSDPSIIGSYNQPNVDFERVFVSDNYGYLAAGESGLYILDISNPANPSFIGSIDTPPGARKVFVEDDYAYVAASDNWLNTSLQVIGVSDPSNPLFAASYELPGNAGNIFVENDYIYVADGSSFRILRFDSETGIIEEVSAPEQFSLSQNYPNPFNPSTSISFALPEPGDVKLTVYDLLGRQVETLLDDYRPAGVHQVIFDASALSSGIYFYRVQAGDMDESKRMMLLK